MNPKNSRELKRTQGNSRELKATWDSSREALVEVKEGKKLRKRGKEVKFQKSENKKRENIEALYERLKIKTRKSRSESFKARLMLRSGHVF